MTPTASTDNVSPAQAAREQEITDRVLASLENTPNPRLQYLLEKLVAYAHAYVREVRLSEAEWNTWISFLTACGDITGGQRQEFILLSDVLGISMQTIAVNNEAYQDATEATVFGPFFVPDAPQIEIGGDISGGAPGQPCWVEGTIQDTEGRPIPRAHLDVWEADEEGLYDVQHEDDTVYGRAQLHADDNGNFGFWALTPTPYPIPHDGPVGELLDTVGRSPYRASHLHFMVTSEGHRTLVTHIFVRGDKLLNSDSVFAVRESLIKEFVHHRAGKPNPTGRDLRGSPWSSVRFDIVLAPAAGTVH